MVIGVPFDSARIYCIAVIILYFKLCPLELILCCRVDRVACADPEGFICLYFLAYSAFVFILAFYFYVKVLCKALFLKLLYK